VFSTLRFLNFESLGNVKTPRTIRNTLTKNKIEKKNNYAATGGARRPVDWTDRSFKIAGLKMSLI